MLLCDTCEHSFIHSLQCERKSKQCASVVDHGPGKQTTYKNGRQMDILVCLFAFNHQYEHNGTVRTRFGCDYRESSSSSSMPAACTWQPMSMCVCVWVPINNDSNESTFNKPDNDTRLLSGKSYVMYTLSDHSFIQFFFHKFCSTLITT